MVVAAILATFAVFAWFLNQAKRLQNKEEVSERLNSLIVYENWTGECHVIHRKWLTPCSNEIKSI